MGFVALQEEPKSGFTPLNTEAGGFTPVEAIRSAQADLPETWNIAGFDTGIAMHPKTAAFMVNAGAKMMGSYRGIKQILGLDHGEEKDNQAAVNRLEQDPNVGGYATGGGFIGSIADPVTLALPVAKGGSLLNMAKYGAIGGGVAGALNPLAEGDSRAVNTVTGAAAGGTLAPVVGTIARRVGTGSWAPLRDAAEAKPGIGMAAPAAEEAAAPLTGQDATKAALRDFNARQTRALAPDLTNPEEVPIQEVLARRRAEFGGINPQLATQMAGGVVGGVTGAATADDDASPAERASRALLGAAAGFTLAKVAGGKIAGMRPGAPQVGSLSGVKAPAESINVIGDAAEPLFKQEVNPVITKKLTTLAGAFFEQNKGLRNPNVLISDDVKANIINGNITVDFAAQHGMTPAELATVARDTVKDAATTMAHYSRLQRDLNLQMTPEERAVFSEAAKSMEDSAYVRPFWKKLTDTWRGLLVTQPVTAVRNYATQVGRVGLDVLQAPIDSWLQKLTGRAQTAHPMDGFEELISLFQRNKDATDKILSAFPSEKQRLFQSAISEVQQAVRGPNPSTGDKVWAGIEDGVGALNILNRTQEFMVRRGIFQATLAQDLRNRGIDLADVIKNNKLGVIPEDSIKNAVQQSLNKTFSESPASGTASRKVIDAINAVPGLNLAIPFPRFMYNAIKFQYQYSPMGVLSYLAPSERAAFAAGDVSKMSKAMIGTGMLGAAFGMRNSDHAGEKWYEYTKDNGDVVDLRPFNPFASYLFAADVLKKSHDGTLYKLTSSDVAQGLLSTNMRAGTGLYLLDNALNLMSKSADEKKLETKAAEFGADFLAGFVTPLTVLRDAYDQFTEGDQIQRDTRQEFLGPIKSRLPIVSQTLPEAESPTREGPRVSVDPLVKQGTGLTTSGPKNALEKELDRLGFDRREVLPSTGDKDLDRQYAHAMGIVSEHMLVPMVESEKFQGLRDSVKGVILHEVLGDVATEVKHAINENLPPEKQMQLEIKKESPRLRYLLEEFGVKP